MGVAGRSDRLCYLPLLQATLTKPPTDCDPGKMRIVSLSPSTTEMLFRPGHGRLARRGDRILRLSARGEADRARRRFRKAERREAAFACRPIWSWRPVLNGATSCQSLRKSGIRVLDVDINNIDEMFQALRRDRRRRRQTPAGRRGRSLRCRRNCRSVAAQIARSEEVAASAGLRRVVGRSADDDRRRLVPGRRDLAGGRRQRGPRTVAAASSHQRRESDRVEPGRDRHRPHGRSVPARRRRSASGSAGPTSKAVKQERSSATFRNDLILRPGPRLIEAREAVWPKRLHEGPAPQA